MKYQYYTCDVFTQTRFGGNPLAVLPKAEGLSDHQMQQIARESNCSRLRERYHLLAIRTWEPHSSSPEKTNGAVTATWVGGSCVMVSEGFIHVD